MGKAAVNPIGKGGVIAGRSVKLQKSRKRADEDFNKKNLCST